MKIGMRKGDIYVKVKEIGTKNGPFTSTLLKCEV